VKSRRSWFKRALKQFLKKAPPREPLPAAWLGFRGVPAHDGSVAGVRVISVDANGPAARAGLRGEGAARSSGSGESGADLIVAVEDAPVTTPEEMRDAINRFALTRPLPSTSPKADAPRESEERRVRLLVFGSGKFREVALPLRPPRELPEAAVKEPAAKEPAAKDSAPKAPTPKSTGGDVGVRSSAGTATVEKMEPAKVPNGAITAPSAPADKAKSPAPPK
jgi:hypothetical protein